MKFLSLFTKVPSNQKFRYNPRYYNPQKERAEQREDRIKKDLGMVGEEKSTSDYSSRIQGSFRNAHKIHRGRPKSSSVALIRLSTILFLVLLLIVYFTWGQVALYGFFLFVPLYLYLKFKKS